MHATVAVKDGARGTPGRILKVDHAGEFGAVNIYRAQLHVSRVLSPALVPLLQEFLAHEQRHLALFSEVLARRGITRCKSYWFCGIGGYLLGLFTALFGKAGVMACTAAVETVVLKHLEHQLEYLRSEGDTEAIRTVEAIIGEETEHQAVGVAEGQASIFYRPLGLIVGAATSFVIWLGMVL